ncbi:lact-2, partial [Symbiodinium sp. KB8]
MVPDALHVGSALEALRQCGCGSLASFKMNAACKPNKFGELHSAFDTTTHSPCFHSEQRSYCRQERCPVPRAGGAIHATDGAKLLHYFAPIVGPAVAATLQKQRELHGATQMQTGNGAIGIDNPLHEHGDGPPRQHDSPEGNRERAASLVEAKCSSQAKVPMDRLVVEARKRSLPMPGAAASSGSPEQALLRTLVAHVASQENTPVEITQLLGQCQDESHRATGKALHKLVSRQQDARRGLAKTKTDRAAYDSAWASYLGHLGQLLETQMTERTEAIRAFDQAEEAWRIQLEESTSELSRHTVSQQENLGAETIDVDAEMERQEQLVADAAQEAVQTAVRQERQREDVEAKARDMLHAIKQTQQGFSLVEDVDPRISSNLRTLCTDSVFPEERLPAGASTSLSANVATQSQPLPPVASKALPISTEVSGPARSAIHRLPHLLPLTVSFQPGKPSLYNAWARQVNTLGKQCEQDAASSEPWQWPRSEPALPSLRHQLAAGVPILPEEYDRPEVRCQCVSHFGWFNKFRATGAVTEPAQQDRFALFTAEHHVQIRALRRGATLDDVAAEVMGVVPRLRNLRFLTNRLEGMPPLQVSATTRDVPIPGHTTPLDMRPAGGRICTLNLFPGTEAHSVSEHILTDCPEPRKPTQAFELFLPDGAPFQSLPLGALGPDFIQGSAIQVHDHAEQPQPGFAAQLGHQDQDDPEDDSTTLVQTYWHVRPVACTAELPNMLKQPRSQNFTPRASDNRPVVDFDARSPRVPSYGTCTANVLPLRLPPSPRHPAQDSDPPSLLKRRISDDQSKPAIGQWQLHPPALREPRYSGAVVPHMTWGRRNDATTHLFTVFDTRRHLSAIPSNEAAKVEDFARQAISTAPGPVRAIQFLTAPVPGLPLPQLVLTLADDPADTLAIPWDCRAAGLPISLIQDVLSADLTELQWLRVERPIWDEALLATHLRLPDLFASLRLGPPAGLGGPVSTTSTTTGMMSDSIQTYRIRLFGDGKEVSHDVQAPCPQPDLVLCLLLGKLQHIEPSSYEPAYIMLAKAQPPPVGETQEVLFLSHPNEAFDVMPVFVDGRPQGGTLVLTALHRLTTTEHAVPDHFRHAGCFALVNGAPAHLAQRSVMPGDYAQLGCSGVFVPHTATAAIMDRLTSTDVYGYPFVAQRSRGDGSFLQRIRERRRTAQVWQPLENLITIVGPAHGPVRLRLESVFVPTVEEVRVALIPMAEFNGMRLAMAHTTAQIPGAALFVTVCPQSDLRTVLLPLATSPTHHIVLMIPSLAADLGYLPLDPQQRTLCLADLVPCPAPAVTWGVNDDIREACLAGHTVAHLHGPEVHAELDPTAAIAWNLLPVLPVGLQCDELFVFTDGSYFKDATFSTWALVALIRSGSAVYRAGFWAGVTHDLHGHTSQPSAYDGELEALLHALALAAATPCMVCHIGADCESAVAVATGSCPTAPTDRTARAAVGLNALTAAQGKTIHFHKVVAHSGCGFNDLADQLAKRVGRKGEGSSSIGPWENFWQGISETVVDRLWLTAKHPNFPRQQITVLSAHAPQTTKPIEELETWWQHLRTILHRAPSACLPICCIDANATFVHDAEQGTSVPKCANARLLQTFLAAKDLCSSPAFLPNGEPAVSWVSPQGHKKLIDYVLFPYGWQSQIKLLPSPGLGDLFADIDHRPITVSLEVRTEVSDSRPAVKPSHDWCSPHTAVQARTAAGTCPHVPWDTSGTVHVDSLQKHLVGSMSHAADRQNHRPRNPAIQHSTLDKLHVQRHLRRCHRRTQATSDRAFLHLCLQAWKHGAATPTHFLRVDKQLRVNATYAWVEFYRQCRIVRRSLLRDKAAFARQAFETSRAAGPAAWAHKLRAVLRVGRKFKAPPLIPALTGEDAALVGRSAVLDGFAEHFAKAERATPAPLPTITVEPTPELPPTALEGSEFPTIADVAHGFASLQKGRASGISGLPCELYRTAPLELAFRYWPVVCKTILRDCTPAQWTGGLAVAIPKPQKPDDRFAGYRSIMLLEADGKGVQKAVRPSVMKVLGNIKVADQFGGIPGCTLQLPSAIVKAHLHYLKRTKQSGALVFIDAASAYYAIARDAIALTDSQRNNVAFLRQRAALLFNDPALRDHFVTSMQKGDVAQAMAATPATRILLQKHLRSTWYVTRAAGRFHATVTGHDIDNPGFSPTWADDVCLLLQVACPTALAEAVSVATAYFLDSMTRHGLQANLGRGKTEALIACYGTGSAAVKRSLLTPDVPQIPFKGCHVNGSICLAEQYTHLGSIVRSDGQSLPDILRRRELARDLFRPIKAKLLSNPYLYFHEKVELLRGRVLPKFLYGAGLWSFRTTRERSAAEETIFSFYRGAFRPTFGFSAQGYTNEEIAGALRLPLPSELLAVEQARVLVRLHVAGLVHVLEELSHDSVWWADATSAVRVIGLLPAGSHAAQPISSTRIARHAAMVCALATLHLLLALHANAAVSNIGHNRCTSLFYARSTQLAPCNQVTWAPALV